MSNVDAYRSLRTYADALESAGGDVGHLWGSIDYVWEQMTADEQAQVR
jgi:hypothetical protein